MTGPMNVQLEAVDQYGQPPGFIVSRWRGGEHLSPTTERLGQRRLEGCLMVGPSASNPGVLSLLVTSLTHRQPLVAPGVETRIRQVSGTGIKSGRSDST